jgi:hypothetical protein
MGRTVGTGWRELEFEEMSELLMGPEGPSAFADDAEREEAWRHHGTDLVAGGAYQPGDRAWAAWRYDVGIEEPATRLERVVALQERGLLTDTEREDIAGAAEWARGRTAVGHYTSSPPVSPKEQERRHHEHCDELIAIAEAIASPSPPGGSKDGS